MEAPKSPRNCDAFASLEIGSLMSGVRRFLVTHMPWNWVALGLGIAGFTAAGLSSIGGASLGVDSSTVLFISLLFMGSSVIGLRQASISSLMRKELSIEIVQKFRFASETYAQAMASARRQAQIAGPVSAGSDEGESADSQRAREDLIYLLDFFRYMAVGLEHAALDAQILRSALKADLAVVYRLAQPTIAADRVGYKELHWLAQNWRVA